MTYKKTLELIELCTYLNEFKPTHIKNKGLRKDLLNKVVYTDYMMLRDYTVEKVLKNRYNVPFCALEETCKTIKEYLRLDGLTRDETGNKK